MMRMRVLVMIVVMAFVGFIRGAEAQTFNVIFNFGAADGAWPYGTLVLDGSGNLYGTTYQGGYGGSVGEVFELSPSGAETVLHSFSENGDGYWPFSGVTRTANGNLYGTTYYGGGAGGSGFGTVFMVDSYGNESVLHAFTGGTTDGCNPGGGVVLDAQGNLYGTTSYCGVFGYGTVWELNANGTETVLHSFSGGATDGATPAYGNLIVDSAGNLYGVTNSGGPANVGTLFKIDPSGNETILYSFAGQPNDGGVPNGTPVRDSKGNLYGATSYGGPTNNGTVWKLDASGVETVLHNFNGGADDGAFPQSGVVEDSKDNLYGSTYYGGAAGSGAVWELSKAGTFTLLHSIDGGSDGCCPVGGVVLGANGTIYGTSYYGGSSYYGTVWQVSPSVTTTTLLSSVNPSAQGKSVTFTALVSSPGTPTGKVQYLNGSTLLATVTLTSGSTKYTTSKLPPGSNSITAVYEGDSFNNGSTSAPVQQVVLATTTTTITPSLNPSAYGQTVMFSAMVTSASGVPPDGETVTFEQGSAVLGTGTLSGGTATFSTSTLAVGTKEIKAMYGGDSSFSASTSASISQVIGKATSATAVVSTENPSSAGDDVTFTAAVSPQFSGTPSGTVVFKDGTKTLKTVTLSAGTASYTTSTLASGTHNITANYNGSTEFTESEGSVTQTVN